MADTAVTLLPAAQCPGCELVVYPRSATSCPRCGSAPLHVVDVPGDGVVWSHTVQRFAPKSPPYRQPGETFEPFVVAYVQTMDGGRIAGIVEGVAPDEMRIGLPVRLVSCTDVPRFTPSTEEPR